MEPSAPADAAATSAAPVAAPEAAAAPSPGAQIADVVAKEFPSYDRNKDGKLSQTEFGSWMYALRKANDPSLKDDAANKTYNAGAFKTADVDKSKSVSKDELVNYLAQGQTAATPVAPAPAAAAASAPAPAAPPAAAVAPVTPMPQPAPTPPATSQPDK